MSFEVITLKKVRVNTFYVDVTKILAYKFTITKAQRL